MYVMIISVNQAISIPIEYASSITQYDITWYFEEIVTYGQFANGDYYVIGNPTIVAVDPIPANGRNGSMINPTAESHAYDDRVAQYDSNQSIHFPYTMSPGESLVSTISLTEDDLNGDGVYIDWSGRQVGESHSRLKTAAILTCLSETPPQGTLRPPYCGTNKPLYNINNISQINDVFPSLYDTGSISIDNGVIDDNTAYFTRGLQRPWIMNNIDYSARYIQPTQNMLNYYREMGVFFSDLALYLSLDISTEDKEKIILNLIQVGIDSYYMSVTGIGDSQFFKYPIFIAGLLLNDSALMNLTNCQIVPREDRTYYLPDGESTLTSLIITGGNLWTGYSVFNPRPAWREDAGDKEHEHLDITEWSNLPVSDGGAKREAYRRIGSPLLVGIMLGILLMDEKAAWNHDALFDYADRWMDEDGATVAALINTYYAGTVWETSASGYQAASSFVKTMWNEYR
jgi:hypothetical protein